MDFFRIATKEKKGGAFEAYPDFIVGRSDDLMVRAKAFYAIWDEEAGLWSTDMYDVQRLVDAKLRSFHNENKHLAGVKYMESFGTGGQATFNKFLREIGDNAHQLDESLTFKSQKVVKKDYASKRLSYDLAPGDHSAWDKMIGTLYNPKEREKIEWYIGSIVSGDSKTNQKFIVLYGPPGAGKGTVIDILLRLFDGYVTTFDAKQLGSGNNQFAAAAFANNPLVAIQHDGDLSKIEDNTILNSIVSHEIMKMNEKYKASYDARINAALVMGTNKPVKITDAQSGLIRRLIDIHPSGNRFNPEEYHQLKDKIVTFELGAIAHHCLQVYKTLGKNKYSNYRPTEMMFKTNAFFNFVETYYDLFEKQDGTSVNQAWKLFKEYREEAELTNKVTLYQFKSELGNYFKEFKERHTMEDGTTVRQWYSGFIAQPFLTPVDGDVKKLRLLIEETTSLLDLEFADYAAQYVTAQGAPRQKWDNVKTTLAEIDTSQEHFVMGFPDNHIVIDFDLKDDDGNKSLEKNLDAASSWPATYAELSKSGSGVHLHYTYIGDVQQLDSQFLPGIEIKVFTGHSALRRRLSLCNDVPVASISNGLPLKEKKRVLEPGTLKSEKALRDLITRNLRKEIHPGTKSSIDFINHILNEAYEDGIKFDVSDMRGKITAFANNSSNRALECLKIVQNMRFQSSEEIPTATALTPADSRIAIYDCEVYPNLFVVCWKFVEDDPSSENVTRMINPTAQQIEALFDLKLVGFYNRNYDNHILWGAALGFNNAQLYNLSQKLVNGAVGAKFGEAYNISYTDILDFSTEKMSLKKWQIKLGLKHQEMDLDWDQPVPDDRVMDVVEYCVNDVISTEKVFKHLAGDWRARQILADLSGLSPNETTAKQTARIIFGNEKNPQKNFVYTQLDKEFPGYVFEAGKSTYRDEEVGEGGLVRSKPGLWRDVALLDIASMHPTTIGQLNLFGEYTPRYMALVAAQLAIKRGDYAAAKDMFDGKLRPYISEIEALVETDPAAAKKSAALLRHGLKIAMNIVYGLTSAKFENPFKDSRNIDNIVAKRGALFMVDLMKALEERGTNLVHIKTDSVKIANATQEDIDFVMTFGSKYGYTFEHEADYAKLGLVNDAVYVAKKDECITNCWTATGTQYQHPYVFKKLFGYEDDICFEDLCETKSVMKGLIYLDFGDHIGEAEGGYINHAVAQQKLAEKSKDPEAIAAANALYDRAIKRLVHIGRVGQFTPVKEGFGGGQLYRVMEGKHYAVAGTKGYLWVDSSIGETLPDEAIDYNYFDKLQSDAVANLEKFIEASDFSSVEEFLS